MGIDLDLLYSIRETSCQYNGCYIFSLFTKMKDKIRNGEKIRDNPICRFQIFLPKISIISGGFRGAHPPPPHGPKFSRFHAVFWKIWQNCMLAPPPPRGLAHPPTGNPGSAPDNKQTLETADNPICYVQETRTRAGNSNSNWGVYSSHHS